MIHRALSFVGSLSLVLVLAMVGTAPVQAAPPSNDDVASATLITAPLPFTETIDTREATGAPGDPDCFGSGATVWYQFTFDKGMELTIDTFGSDYDTTLSVYTGAPGSLIQERCKDYPTMQYVEQAALHLDTVPNETYYIMVGGSGGTLVFNIEPYHEASMDIQIDPSISFDRDGQAILRGTFTCPDPIAIDWMEGKIEQKSGTRVVVGKFEGFSEWLCWGEESWEILAIAEGGRWRGGPATVSMHGLSFDITTWYGVDVETSAIVHLHAKKK